MASSWPRWLLALAAAVMAVACGGTGDNQGEGTDRPRDRGDDGEPGISTTEPAGNGQGDRRARLAYLSRTGEPLELIAITLPNEDDRGQGNVLIAGDVRSAGGYAWSPDGKQIVYSRFLEEQPSASQLVIRTIDGSGEKVLTSEGFDDRYPAFSPDGQRVVFRRGPARAPGSDLYVIERDGTGLRHLVDDPSTESLFPTWSPDGKRIAYQRFPRDGEAPPEPQVAVVHADGSNHRVIAEQAVQPAWSPDGELLAFVSSQAPGRTSTDLRTMRPDGSDVRTLATDVAGQPVWSPDGEHIAFSAQGEGPNVTDLAVIARDGTGKRVLTDVRPQDGSPTWSPDGDTLVFVAAEIEGAGDLYSIVLSGRREPQRLTRTGRADSPTFGPA